MEGTIVGKIARVVYHTIKDPRHVVPWLQCLRKEPVDVGLPWFSFEAIEFLANYVTNNTVILEFGAGGSTIFFGARAGRVISVEMSRDWARRVQARLQADSKVIVTEQPDALPSAVDVLVIDHHEPPWDENARKTRRETFWEYWHTVKPGGIAVLDDSWRHERWLQQLPWPVRRFRGMGPCRLGVTETAVIFKPTEGTRGYEQRDEACSVFGQVVEQDAKRSGAGSVT